MKPILSILPPAQFRIWTELEAVDHSFVLYGGTALALRLGHRQSEDFDFFSPRPLDPDELERRLPFLKQGVRLQSGENTLVITVDRDGPVKLSFFGGLTLDRVNNPDDSEDNHILIASLEDLAATKMRVVQSRAQAKDYLDVAELIRRGIILKRMLSCAQTVYGQEFNPAITLKALSYFKDGDLPTLPKPIQELLQEQAWNVRDIPPPPVSRKSILPD